MVPFRRNVSVIMDRDIYKKLGNQPDTEKAWKLVRCTVGEEIFKRDFVAVPEIQSARYYNQLFVFKKQLDLCSILKLRKPRYKIINNIDNLLNIEISTWIPRYDFSPWTARDSSMLLTEFKMVLSSSPNENLQKSIEVTIKNLHIRSATPPDLQATTLNTISSRAYVIYIITSVVFANYVKICVCVGSKQNVFLSRNATPIGFKYRKYRVLADGHFDTEMETTLKIADKEAMWLPPTDSPIIWDPFWDPMGRRHDGSRPNRNIWTMATSPQILSHLQRNRNRQFILRPNNNNFQNNNAVPLNIIFDRNIFIDMYHQRDQSNVVAGLPIGRARGLQRRPIAYFT